MLAQITVEQTINRLWYALGRYGADTEAEVLAVLAPAPAEDEPEVRHLVVAHRAAHAVEPDLR